MNGRPSPPTRHANPEHQIAYETGFVQMRDHDSFRTLDWVEHAVDDVHDEAERCRRRAALLEGCADALLELADRQLESAVLWEAPTP